MSRRSVPFQIVDVFAGEPFQGNRAGVVLQAAGLSDEEMRRIAAELGPGETAFLVPVSAGVSADLRLRWFTHVCELTMSGHATMAVVHALDEGGLLPTRGQGPAGGLAIETAGGMLYASVERPGQPGVGDRPLVWLDLIAPALTATAFTPDAWAELLGGRGGDFLEFPPPVRTQDGDLLVFVRDFMVLQDFRPRVERLELYLRQQRLRGLCVVTTTTLDMSIDAQCRFFAPGIGITEDSVTGSVHGPIAACLIACGRADLHGGLTALTCTQAAPCGRGGLVRVLAERQVDGHVEVRIGGECTTTVRGEIRL